MHLFTLIILTLVPLGVLAEPPRTPRSLSRVKDLGQAGNGPLRMRKGCDCKTGVCCGKLSIHNYCRLPSTCNHLQVPFVAPKAKNALALAIDLHVVQLVKLVHVRAKAYSPIVALISLLQCQIEENCGMVCH